MAKLSIRTNPEDEQLVREIMQMIDGYKSTHRPMRQVVALHAMLKERAELLSKKHTKEKEKREEKEAQVATDRPGQVR